MCMGSNPSYWLWSTVGRTCTQVWSTLIFSIAVFWKGDWLGLFKTQLIHFSHSLSSSCSACIYFCDHLLPFLDTVSHLDHLLHYDLNDTEDVNSKLRDMVRKANCLLANFPRVGPFILTHLFQSYTVCLFMALALDTLMPCSSEPFNEILHRIWSLPACSHTHIVHLVANLRSLFNVIYCRSNSLLHAAAHCPSVLVQTMFRDSSLSCFSFCGYNNMFGDRHPKQYFVEDHTCAAVLCVYILVLITFVRIWFGQYAVTSSFLCVCVCVFVSLVVYFHYTTPNVGVLYGG